MASLADNVVLLTLPWTRRHSTQLRYAVAGACIIEAVHAGHARLDRACVLVDADAGGDDYLTKLAKRSPETLMTALREGRPAVSQAVARLAERGLVDEQRRRLLGLVPSTRYDVDADAHDDVREEVRAVLIDGEPPDSQTAELILLAGSARMHRSMFFREERETANARIRSLEVDHEAATVCTAIRETIKSDQRWAGAVGG